MISLLIAFVIACGAAYGLVAWAIKAETDRSGRVGLYLLHGIIGGLLVVAGLATVTFGKEIGPVLLASGLGVSLPLFRRFRELIARAIPIDPASLTDMSGLSIFLGVLLLLIVVTWDSPEPDPVEGSVNYGELIIQMLTWVGLAYIVVGTTLRRTFREANARLGLFRPSARTLGTGVGLFFAGIVVNYVFGVLTIVFQPDTSDKIQQGLQDLTGDVQNPIGALAIGISAGIGEELFFRGALQPRFGIVLTALCFALLHANYGLSFVTAGIFGLGVVFGIGRQRYGTTSAMIAHALVNIVAVLAQTYL